MKLLKFNVIALAMFSANAHAVTPVHGWYAGLMLGGSHAPDITFNLNSPQSRITGAGALSYSLLGDVGGQVGYRVKHFRVEGEAFYNNNGYRLLSIHNTRQSLKIPNTSSNSTDQLQMSGFTNTYAFMINGFHDFYKLNFTQNIVPYLGLGLGYAYVQNNIEFFNSGIAVPGLSTKQFSNNFAAQAIAGVNYFLSDYSSFGLDFRYFSSLRANTLDTRFNSFSSRPQLYTINLIFNGSFNLG